MIEEEEEERGVDEEKVHFPHGMSIEANEKCEIRRL